MAETRRPNFCGSPDHAVDRRRFLGSLAAGAAAVAGNLGLMDALKSPALAGELKKRQKRVILLWLAGASSQLETWDPKPGTLHRRPVPRHRHQRPGDPDLRADAEDGRSGWTGPPSSAP